MKLSELKKDIVEIGNRNQYLSKTDFFADHEDTLELYKELPYKALNEELFFSFVRLAFNQRRKTFINNISQKYDKEFALKMLNYFNIKENVRSEELTVKDFVMLSDYIEENYEN